MRSPWTRTLRAVLLAAATLIPAALAAQAPVAADAKPFLGGWTLGLETPQGALSMDLIVKEQDGKVTGQIASQLAPEPQAITDVTKSGTSLVLKYSLDFQGTAIPAKITMTPAGEKMGVSFDFADGQFTVDGTATKK
jgi:hypothetical protein